jgi:hypothetical protein
MCQKGVILLDSVDLIQAQNCQVDLTHALGHLRGLPTEYTTYVNDLSPGDLHFSIENIVVPVLLLEPIQVIGDFNYSTRWSVVLQVTLYLW